MELVHYEVARAIATITLDSPHNRNALSMQLVGELADHLARAAADDAVRAVVLTHTGTVFCAGADLREQSTEGGPEHGTKRMLGLLRTVLETPKPIVARVDGAARAGGVGLVGSCDIALASRGSTFAFTEVRLGLAPAIISLTTLGRLTERAAARYCLTGETFDATAAAAAGLLTVAADDLDAELAGVLTALRACSPQGLAATKPLTTRDAMTRVTAQAEEMRALSARLFASEEAREGMQAFLEKRPPRWAAI
ncbi:MAG TPA: enoyl-CoA hydratase family protein [Jatrophihabitans sp.]|nr:enoyl-CoA hydratase family protein [Jatrophihabitans sp.]